MVFLEYFEVHLLWKGWLRGGAGLEWGVRAETIYVIQTFVFVAFDGVHVSE